MSVSRSHRDGDTHRPSSIVATQQRQQRHESPTAAPALPSETTQRSFALARVTRQEPCLPALQPPKMCPSQPTTAAAQTRDVVTTSKEEDATILQLSPPHVIGPCGQRKADVLGLIVSRAVRDGPAGAPWAVPTRLGLVATGKLPGERAGGSSDGPRGAGHEKPIERDPHDDVSGIRKRAGGMRWTLTLGHITRPPQLAPG